MCGMEKQFFSSYYLIKLEKRGVEFLKQFVKRRSLISEMYHDSIEIIRRGNLTEHIPRVRGRIFQGSVVRVCCRFNVITYQLYNLYDLKHQSLTFL